MSDNPTRPTADDILGPAPTKPTADDVLGPAPEKYTEPLSGVAWDDIASGNNPIGHILNDFGHGVKQAWGANPTGISKETEDWLRQVGIWNDQKAGHESFMKTLNEAVMRPAAVAINAGVALGTGVYRALGENVPGAGAFMEAFPAGHFTGFPANVPIPQAYAAVREARALRVIGEGEAGWKGTAADPPVDMATAQAEAVKATQAAATEETPGLATPPAETAEPGIAPTEPPPDVHQIARRLAPTMFEEFDALDARRGVLQRAIDDLDEQRGEGSSPEIAALDRRIDDLRGQRLKAPRTERTPLANRITAMEEDRAKLVDALPKTGDTPAMADYRRQMIEARQRQWDLAPQVSAAYRQAQELIATPEAVPPISAAPAQPPVAEPTPAAGVPETPGPLSAEAPAAPSATRAAVPDIAADVSQKLVAAGRPAEEADAAAALVAAHYEARAARFDGARGSGAEMYATDAPNIVGGAGPGRAGIAGSTILRDGQATINLFGRADASTFIHETGHQWLDEMVRDAGNDLAPPNLKADADTVRQWLGAEPDASLTTRQHEKFARGFERYMMEGRAPSHALAGVFAKFKEWLTTIYQTVAKLRAPITDDIRQVFDRMLSTEGEKPVIAPEREASAPLSETHERIAEVTPAPDAGAAADQVRAEIEAEAAKNPEVNNEIGAGRRGAEAGADARENQPVDRNATPAGSIAGNAPNAEQPGAIEPGRSEAAPQGDRLPQGSTTTIERPTEQSAGADQPFSRAESALIDKAGNIRLDNLNTPEDVNAVLRETADQNGEFLTARRGVLSDAEVLDLADALGMRPADLNARQIGQAFNAEEVMAARKLLVQSAIAVRDAAGKVADASMMNEVDVLAYAEAKARHRMIQEQVSGVTAEAGRALRAFRAIEGTKEAEAIGQFLAEATGDRTLYQLRREARALYQLKTPQQASKMIADSEKKGFFDWLQSYFINALISGPATHGEYMVGNTLFALYKSTAETGAAALVGRIRTALTGASEAERVQMGEVPAQVYGMLRGYRNGWQAAWDAFKSNETMPLPGEKLTARTPFTKVIPNPEIGGVRVPIGDVIELPSRGVTALHAFSRTVGYSRSIAAQAYRFAFGEGLDGSALASRIADLTENPPERMMQEAVAEANEDAMMQHAKFGSFTQKIAALTNAGIPLPDIPLPGGHAFPLGTLRPIKFIDPFVTIASNIINATLVRRTPLGFMSEQMRADLSGANGGVALDKAAGRMLAGTTFMLAAGGLAAEGLLTGSGPSDPKESAMRRLTGWMPHSIRIGETYYDIRRLGVLGMLTGISADLYEAGHAIATEDAAKVASMASHAFSQNVLDESFMRGPSELIRALTESDRYGPQFVRQFLSSFVPFSVGLGQIARTVDPYSRQARDTMDAIQAKIPWLSEALLPRRDIWGEPMPNKAALVPGVTAIYESRVNNDPVNQAFIRLGAFPGQIERKVRGVELTDQQYDDLSRTGGRMAKMRLDQIVGSPNFAQMPDFVQRELLTKTLSFSREAARSLLLMQNPGIITSAINAKRALISGAKPEDAREMLRHQPAAPTVH